MKIIKKLKSSKNVLIFADKTINVCEVTSKMYKKCLTNNITFCKKSVHMEPDEL